MNAFVAGGATKASSINRCCAATVLVAIFDRGALAATFADCEALGR